MLPICASHSFVVARGHCRTTTERGSLWNRAAHTSTGPVLMILSSLFGRQRRETSWGTNQGLHKLSGDIYGRDRPLNNLALRLQGTHSSTAIVKAATSEPACALLGYVDQPWPASQRCLAVSMMRLFRSKEAAGRPPWVQPASMRRIRGIIATSLGSLRPTTVLRPPRDER